MTNAGIDRRKCAHSHSFTQPNTYYKQMSHLSQASIYEQFRQVRILSRTLNLHDINYM